MAYDPEATLSSWQDPQSGTSDAFLHDNQGERVEQQVSSSTGTTTTTCGESRNLNRADREI
jgi:hypothetical protein